MGEIGNIERVQPVKEVFGISPEQRRRKKPVSKREDKVQYPLEPEKGVNIDVKA